MAASNERIREVVDELLDLRRADLGRMERPRHGAQHGMPHLRHLQYRHT